MFDFETLKDKQIVLFGVGNEGVCAVDILKKNGVEPICFCDNYKQGEKAGLPIITVNELVRDYPGATIVITAIGYADEIITELKKHGIGNDRIVTEFKAHRYKQPYLAYYEINIVDHCDITCMGCSHFSPIAVERVSPLETVQNDLRRMSELTAQNVDEIHILGGEPLLHPDLNEILITAREAFPNTIISVITNGIRLSNQDEIFWEVCRKNRITIEVTKYPIKLDYDKLIKLVESKKVAFKYHSYTGKATKTLYKMPLDLEGKQNAEKSFADCTLANRWIALMDGKMYTCQVAPNVYHFNKQFGTNLDLEEGDYLDIYKANNIDEILDFLSTPKPFCKYCKTAEIINGIPWQPSKREISEWT
jgi:organic radical activating enzyme